MASNRSEVTLPTAPRERLGIKGGGVVVAEDRAGEIVLKPGVVLELDLYADEVAQWNAQHRLEDEERQRLAAAVVAGLGTPLRDRP